MGFLLDILYSVHFSLMYGLYFLIFMIYVLSDKWTFQIMSSKCKLFNLDILLSPGLSRVAIFVVTVVVCLVGNFS